MLPAGRLLYLLCHMWGTIGLPFTNRNAVDFGFPLLNNARCAQLFVESMAQKIPKGSLRPYTEGRIPSEVHSWREFVGEGI